MPGFGDYVRFVFGCKRRQLAASERGPPTRYVRHVNDVNDVNELNRA
jgi:hypothetical protein